MHAALAQVLGVLVAWPCVPQDATPRPATVKIGESVTGEVRGDSPLVHTPTLDQNYTDAPVRGVSYTLELTAGAAPDVVTIELRSYFFDAYLVVRDAKGRLVAEDDDGLLRSHARVVLRPDATTSAAKYEVAACALHGGDGPFELRIAAESPAAMNPREKQQAEIDDARRAVSVVEARFGADDPATAASLNDLADLLRSQGNFEETRALLERALAIRSKALGPEHPATATSLNNLAWLLGQAGKLKEARPLFERALAIREKVLAPGHLEIAQSLNNLAWLLRTQGEYDKARPLFERALAMNEKLLGPNHPEIAANVGNLGLLLRFEGKYEEARPFFERALAIDERAFGPDDPTTAADLINLALLNDSQGKYEEARKLLERALAIDEKALGPQHHETATSLNGLGLIFHHEGKFEQARQCYERALAIREATLGPWHPYTALCLNNLAGLFETQGKYEEARPLLSRALAIQEKVAGPEHADIAVSLCNLAALLDVQGKYDEARALYERALTMREKILEPGHPEIAVSLDNLAGVLVSQGKHDEARPLIERARAIREKALGPGHPETGQSLNNLAGFLMDEGKYEEARPLLEQALAISESAHGPDHPYTARSLSNLAASFSFEGRYDDARPLFERAHAIDRKVFGAEHPDTATMLRHLALNDLNLHEPARARERANESLKSWRAHTFEETARASSSDALRVFASIHDAIETLLSAAAPSERASDATYAEVLLAKGGAFRMSSQRRRALAERFDPETRATLEQLQIVRAAMSNLFSQAVVPDRAEHDRNIERLREEREECETKLAQIAAARPELEPVTPAQLRAALPKDAVVLDFLEHRLYAPAQWQDGKVVQLGKWGERRFSVWISHGDESESTWVDLGPSAAIGEVIRDYLDDVVGVRGAVIAMTREESTARVKRLRELVWDPIAAHLGAASCPNAVKHVIVAADGALATLPFGLIVDAAGHYLIEQYSFTQIEDASAVARPLCADSSAQAGATAAPAPLAPSLLVAGAIDYQSDAPLPDEHVAASTLRGGGPVWAPLSNTQSEVDEVATRHHQCFVDAASLRLVKDAPTEERLKAELPHYSVLHLATHGYFFVEGMKSVTDALHEEEKRGRFEADERRLLASYWPQFLCGVVCSGANHPEPNRDNGLLTGDEVSGLDLSHCDLVVLSACETALGQRQAGEGLLSLTRSFREAGARTVISSLWQVRDDSTKELMVDFYDRLWNQHESKLDALRDAQLAMLKKNRERYGGVGKPIQWGAFVLTGETK